MHIIVGTGFIIEVIYGIFNSSIVGKFQSARMLVEKKPNVYLNLILTHFQQVHLYSKGIYSLFGYRII